MMMSILSSRHLPIVALLMVLHHSYEQTVAFAVATPPAMSPATGLPNLFYTWKEGLQIRYQRSSGHPTGEPVVLIHGLFVNSDHWRKSIKALGDAGYNAYALDLLGSGYSAKPSPDSPVGHRINGENGRFSDPNNPSILTNVALGHKDGDDYSKSARYADVDLRHPLQSPYNFYTWSDLITDFCKEVVLRDNSKYTNVTLVCNSIGTMSALQAVIDTPDLYNGVFAISPNFRELHSAELPFPTLVLPILQAQQAILRTYGQVAFNALAKPEWVRRILQVPYARKEAVDDTLVQVLLDPLLTEGASRVVFDTLSYSAGPLPEQQLSMFPPNKPVWVCYGKADPWTPGPRVESLIHRSPVERVQGWEGVGHCPHDEAPELVHPFLLAFLDRLGLHRTELKKEEVIKSAQTSASNTSPL